MTVRNPHRMNRVLGIIVVITLLLAIWLSGCIEIGDMENSGSNTALQPASTPANSQPALPVSAPLEPVPVVTPTADPGGVVRNANPIPPRDAIQTEYRNVGIDDPPLAVPGDYPSREIFRGDYYLLFNNVGLIANITDAPLIIDFHVNPSSSNVNDCFFELTVRDNQTRRILGEEGYGKLYSVAPDKRMVFRSPGEYHINLYGSRVGVAVSVKTGIANGTLVPVAPVAVVPAEEEW